MYEIYILAAIAAGMLSIMTEKHPKCFLFTKNLNILLGKW